MRLNIMLYGLLIVLFLILTWLINNYPERDVTRISQHERFLVEQIEKSDGNWKYHLRSSKNSLIIQTEDELNYKTNDTLKIIGYK